MSSHRATTDDTATDHPDIISKLAHLKTYTFFLFYHHTHIQTSTSLQKLQFKLRDERAAGSHEMRAGSDASWQVQIQFYNLECESQRLQGLLDIRSGGLETKSKIVCYCSEEGLIQLIEKAALMAIDLSNIPVILTHPHPNSDFSSFCGWNEANMAEFIDMPMSQLETIAKKWIQAAQQKVDIWVATIILQEDGRLQKLVGQTFETIETTSTYEQRFMSHLSLGHHVRLSKNYSQRCHPPNHKTTNGFIYGWERFKNFCCLGSSNMKASTGVVNIHYFDDKGEEVEVLKHLREYEGSEESELEASKVIKTDKGILSLLIANIDRFHGDKFDTQLNCKPGDGRVELAVFEGVNKCRRLGSVGGEVVLRLQSESAVQLQVGETVYRCWGCRELRVRQSGRIKISINKDVLEC